ncbi:MAG: PAS domain-containing protein [Deltaproteobacteria bacterium]
MRDLLKSNQELLKENLTLKKRIQELEQSKTNSRAAENNLNDSDADRHKRNEQELAITLQRLRFHMGNTPLAEVEFDKCYRITSWSKQAEKIFGWTGDEVLGKRISDLRWVHEDDVQHVGKLSADMLASSRTSNIHINRNYRKDGSAITCEWYNSALLDEQGKLISVHSLVLDITKRVNAEESLRQSEEQYRTLINNMQDVVFRANLDGTITFTSPSAAQILGCSSAEEMIGMNIGNDFYFDPQDAPQHMKTLLEQGKFARQERKLKRKDTGEPVIVSANAQLFYDQTGSVMGIEGVYRDITEQKHIEEDLRKSEAKYRLLHSSMRDAFARVDLDGTIRECNDAFVEMIGYTPEELETLTYRDITPEKWHAVEARIHEKQVFPRGYSDIYEKEYRRKDGTIFPVELRAFLLRDDSGSPLGTWAIIRDITERKQVERDRETLIVELQQAMKKVKTLSGMLPICSSCKKIRDDQGYWNQIESYISDHSGAEFSHGICPECAKKLYPNFFK